MPVAVSYFSIASMAALVLFLGIMIPRALFHLGLLGLGVFTRKRPANDPWLTAIGITFLICAGLAAAGTAFNANAKSLAASYESVTLAFLLFAAPAVLQVMRAWANVHAKQVKVLSHALVALYSASIEFSPVSARTRPSPLCSSSTPTAYCGDQARYAPSARSVSITCSSVAESKLEPKRALKPKRASMISGSAS